MKNVVARGVHMSEAQHSTTAVPGQMVFSGFEEILKVESSRLSKPEQEEFCWEYVTNGGKPGPAYQATINRDATNENARSYACKLLKKDNISQRIKEIVGIVQRKYEHEVLAFRIKGLNLDPKVYFNADGSAKKIVDLPEEHRQGVGLEARYVDGAMRYLPVFPSPEKSAEALQKMFGMNKDKMEVTGKDGEPLSGDSISDIERSARLVALLDGARARRAGQDTPDGSAALGTAAGSAD
jgi:hypothetical protein